MKCRRYGHEVRVEEGGDGTEVGVTGGGLMDSHKDEFVEEKGYHITPVLLMTYLSRGTRVRDEKIET